MSHDDRVANGLLLLEALAAAPGMRVPRDRAQALLGCSDAELESYATLLSTLADREGGGRAIVTVDDREVSLHGDAAALRPVRLDLGESLALAHVLGTLNIDTAVAARVAEALLHRDRTGDDAAFEPLIATTTSYGACYQVLSEAIEDGARCRIAYRAHDEATAATRLVDPYRIAATPEAAYLIAWNVEKDAERRYRLDRIERVEFTDDSVVPHTWQAASPASSLGAKGTLATVACTADCAAQLTWAGIAGARPAPDDPETTLVDVYVGSERWLFDEVLASAGAMRITAPDDMVRRFVSYAKGLRA